MPSSVVSSYSNDNNFPAPFLSIAVTRPELVVTKLQGKITMTVRGPETKATPLGDSPADGEWFGIVLQLGTFLPHLPTSRLTGRIVVSDRAIVLPRLGRLRLKEREYLPTGEDEKVQILSATVSEQAGHWYVSVQLDEEQTVPENAGPVVGIDLGVKSLATLSDGAVIPNPRHLKRRLGKLKKLQRVVSRRQKGSKNRKKAVHKLARLHRQIKNQRNNTLHQVTTRPAKTKSECGDQLRETGR